MVSLCSSDRCSTGSADEDSPPPCVTAQHDLWFAQTPDDVELAKHLCGLCPKQQPCLQGALDRREVWGVWGGQLLQDGVILPRKRMRGRPRKVEGAAPVAVDDVAVAVVEQRSGR